jgi:hypothetical protein
LLLFREEIGPESPTVFQERKQATMEISNPRSKFHCAHIRAAWEVTLECV